MPPVLLSLLDPSFLKKCLRLPGWWVKVTAGVAAFVMMVITLLVGWAVIQGVDDPEVICDGPRLSTPVGVREVDFAEKFGKVWREFTDGKVTPADTVALLNGMATMWQVIWHAFDAPVKGDLEHSAVTGYRSAADGARDRKLAGCCAQLAANQAPQDVPRVEAKPGAPWDPKQASLQTGGQGFASVQVRNAATIDTVRRSLGLPTRASLVAVAAAFQESGVKALPYGDRDSLGIFQQRAAWGPATDRLDVARASRMFFLGGQRGQHGLADVKGWQRMSVTKAVYAVQRSAFPDGAAGYEDDAQRLLAAAGSGRVAASLPTAPEWDPSKPFADYCAQLGAQPGGAPAVGGGGPAVPDQPGNPRTVEQAIAWMQANMHVDAAGNPVPGGAPGESVSGHCERYMNLAYGLGAGYGTALEHWNAPGPRTPMGPGVVPPRGSLVFIASSNPAGHVVLSLGGGRVISTDYNSSTGRFQDGVLSAGPLSDIAKWGPVLGWRNPNFNPGASA